MGMFVRAGFAIGVIMVGCLFFSTVFKKKIEETIAPTIFAIITILYVFYSFDRLRIGYIFTLLLILAGGMYSLFEIIKNKQIAPTLQRILTAGFFAFLALSVAAYFITKDLPVHNWDDLRLWGAVPKVLFYNGRLQLGTDAMIFHTMQSYYPGMQLFAFFITKTMGVFYDGGVYFAYAILGFALLVTVLSHSKKKVGVATVLGAIIIFCLPLTFYNNMFDAAVYYLSLYIDPVLGMMCGYVFYLVAQDVNKDLFSQIRFCLALVFIIQLKDSAILFAIAAIACALIMQILKLKSEARALLDTAELKSEARAKFPSAEIANIGRWLIGTGAMVAAASVLWKVQLNRFAVSTHIGLGTPKTDSPYMIIQGFIRTLFTTNLVQQSETPNAVGAFTNASFTYANLMLVFILVYFISYKLLAKEDKQRFLIPTVGIFTCNILFVAGLCYMYLGLGWDVFHSYQRYVNTVMLAVLTFGVLMLMEQVLVNGKKVKLLAIPILITACVFFLPFSPIPQKFSPWLTDEYLWDATAAHHNRIATGVQTDGYNGTARVNYVMSKNDTYDILHHTLYFALLENNIRINFTPITESLRPFYTAATQEAQKQQNEAWLMNADYIYIFDYDKKFVENFGEYFKAGASEIGESSLYRIHKKGEAISLEYVTI